MASRRTVVWVALLVALCAPPAAAKEWARKMFSATSHNFGTVARGANIEYHFTIDNIYLEDVEISSVSSTCGCTLPKLNKKVLKTYETADLVAQLDTRRFSGYKQATIKVEFVRPFRAEVQLQVTSYIRSDVVLEPGSVQFGSVAQGKGVSQRVSVSYAGRREWQVVDVVSASTRLAAELREVSRTGLTPNARVEYELVLRLKENAPTGYFQDIVVLQTNDPNRQAAQVPLTVEGHVVAPVSISPASLLVGAIKPQQSASWNLFVRADKPFSIVRVTGPDERFQFTVPQGAKSYHLVPVLFKATGAAGRVAGKIRVETDLPGNPVLEVSVEGEVVPAAGKPDPTPLSGESPAPPVFPALVPADGKTR